MKKQQLKPRDFSASAVQKAVALHTLEHPSVLYPAAVSVLGGFAALLFGGGPIFIALAAGGIGTAFLSWMINFGIRRNHFANAYLEKLHTQMEKQRKQRKHKLDEDLKNYSAQTGQTQFTRLTEKFETFQSMLAQKLSPGELTYGRYLGMAEQVYLGALDNLQRMVDTLKTLRVIDLDYTKKRIEQLHHSESPGDKKELEALQERINLHRQQTELVQQMLAQNEQAMTKLDITIAAIAHMQTEDGHASMDLESAMQELQRLASNAKNYSHR